MQYLQRFAPISNSRSGRINQSPGTDRISTRAFKIKVVPQSPATQMNADRAEGTV